MLDAIGFIVSVFLISVIVTLPYVEFMRRKIKRLEASFEQVKFDLNARMRSYSSATVEVRHELNAVKQEFSQKHADEERDAIFAMGGFEGGEQLTDNQRAMIMQHGPKTVETLKRLGMEDELK